MAGTLRKAYEDLKNELAQGNSKKAISALFSFQPAVLGLTYSGEGISGTIEGVAAGIAFDALSLGIAYFAKVLQLRYNLPVKASNSGPLA